MHTFGTTILLSGIAVMVLAQLYATVMVFVVNPLKGILCLIIPGYVLFVAKREGFYRKFLIMFAAGALGLIIGGSIIL